MRITQVIGVGMLICGLLLFFNTSLNEGFTRLASTYGIRRRIRGGSRCNVFRNWTSLAATLDRNKSGYSTKVAAR
jgi:hypothetical protein